MTDEPSPGACCSLYCESVSNAGFRCKHRGIASEKGKTVCHLHTSGFAKGAAARAKGNGPIWQPTSSSDAAGYVGLEERPEGKSAMTFPSFSGKGMRMKGFR